MYDRENLQRIIYVNGNEVARDTSFPFLGLSDLWVGSYSGFFRFNGQVDELRIRSGVRTQAQIIADMHTTYQPGSIPADMLAYYTMDFTNSFEARLTDLTGNAPLIHVNSHRPRFYVYSQDCNNNGILDECDITDGFSLDCNNNGVPDDCDIAFGDSLDCNNNGVPDECEPDCNDNGIPDECDITNGFSLDCNSNGVPDECEPDCNNNGIPDECDIADGTSQDCNFDGVPDECVPPDCDCDDISDAAEIGPFIPGDGGGLDFNAGATRASSVMDTDFSLSGQSFTVEFWVYRGAPTGTEEIALSSGDNFVNGELIIGFRPGHEFTISFRGNDLDTPLPYPPDGLWHHWACTYDTSTNTRTIYRDGVEAASETGIADDFLGHGPLIVGGLSAGSNFNGVVDELRIFDHARSQPEIVADMNTQYIDGPILSTLHAYYPFGSHAGTDFAGTNDLQLTDPGDAEYIVYSSDTDNDGIPDECQCPADITGEGNLNLQDVFAYLDLFNAENPDADLAAPFGVFNLQDVFAYLALFNAGCP